MVFIFQRRDNPWLDARGVFTPVGTENAITSQLRNQIYVGNGLARVRSRLHEYADDPQELIGRAHTTSCTSSSKTDSEKYEYFAISSDTVTLSP